MCCLLQIITKLGPRFYLGNLLPRVDDWEMVVSGKDMCVWAKRGVLSNDEEPLMTATPESPPGDLTSRKKLMSMTEKIVLEEAEAWNLAHNGPSTKQAHDDGTWLSETE